MESKGKSIVLLDIENLMIAAKRDEHVKMSEKNIVSYICHHLRGLLPDFSSENVYAAVSLPANLAEDVTQNNQEKDKRFKQRKSIFNSVISTLADNDFTVLVVAKDPDAADNALCKIGHQFLDDPSVATLVLATEDGKDPFLSLARQTLQKKKSVRIVAYDKAPDSMKEFNLETMFIAMYFRVVQSEIISDVPKPQAAVQKLPTESSRYKLAIREVYEGGTRLSENHEFLSKLRAVVAFLESRYCRGYQKVSLGAMLNELEINLEYKIPKAELKTILHSLIDFTDLFQKTNMYMLSPMSEFTKRIVLSGIK